jgi:hypothetical protein
MSNKKETPVRWLDVMIGKMKQHGADLPALRVHIDKALQMESQKQQKYDEMLEMLEKHLIFHNAEMEGLQQPSSEMWFDLYEKTEQLIKEAKKL